MDTFIDKLAQRFSAQDMIRANLAAEAKETRKLREKMENYESLLQEMKQINIQNTESAERINQILQDGVFSDKIYLQSLFTQKDELITSSFSKLEEALHTENVKVYRNVQAAICNSLEEQTTKLLEEQQRQIEAQHILIQQQSKKVGKRSVFLTVMSTLTFLGVAAVVALEIIQMLGIALF